MRLGLGSAVVGLLLGHAATAATPGDACLRAARDAERQWGLPAHLLEAIGTVESGLPDAVTGRIAPWPFEANIGGADSVFSSAAQATTLVGWALSLGAAQVDVGCFQINLHFHPTAFARLADGFDPTENARAAAGFLSELMQRTGSWDRATALYHSADPVRGESYRARVMGSWRRLVAAAAVPIPVYTPKTLPAELRARLAGLLGVALMSP